MFPCESGSLDDDYIDVDLHIAEGVFKGFQQNLENLTDFTVNVGDTKFKCHRFVLSSCSGFFEALIRTDMREKSESSCTIEGITPETFGLILDVIYKGKNVLNEENMFEIWHASNQLQIKFLIEACEFFVKMNITSQNFYRIYQEAKLLDSYKVILKVKQFIVKHFSKIENSNVCMYITGDDLIDILKFYQFYTLADRSVSFILKWTYSDGSYLKNEPNNCISTSNMTEAVAGLQRSVCRRFDVTIDDEDDVTLRRSYIDQLLAVVPLVATSDACLKKLMTNRFVIENKEAITLVNKAATYRFGGPKAQSSLTELNDINDSRFAISVVLVLLLLACTGFICVVFNNVM